jgi:hypothetical protein
MLQRIASISALATLVCMSTADAADLVLDARVTAVTNTSSNLQNFAIKVSGGSLNVCGSGWINFPLGAGADADTHKRAFALALTAMTAGLRVRVHNYHGNDCGNASYIELVG